MLHRPPSAAAARARERRARQARYRARLRNGRMAVPVEVDAAILDLLVRTRWLDPASVDDRRAIGRALAAMVADAAK
jgi:hypothetical protein